MNINSKKFFLIISIILFIVITIFVLKINAKNEIIPRCPDCNIIFIDIDTLRADHLGIYGYYRNTSPNIDAFAKKSVLFKNAYSQGFWTIPSIRSLFISSLPILWERRIEQNLTLPRILKMYGYITAAFTGSIDDVTLSQFDVSLDFGGDPYLLNPNYNKAYYKAFNETFNYGLDWVRKNKNKRFFLYLHGYDIHVPYHNKYEDYFDPYYNDTIDYYHIYKQYSDYIDDISKNELQNYSFIELEDSLLTSEQINHIIANYDGGILSVDELFGQFIYELNETGVINKTIIVVFSNHGEDLFENGRFEHLFPSYFTIYVPLIIYIPEVNAKVIDAPVALMDIGPTILNLINITINHTTLGVDLIRLIENPKLADKARSIPGYKYIMKGDWKLITQPKLQLYNLKYDINESNNLVDIRQDKVKELLNEVSEFYIGSYLQENG